MAYTYASFEPTTWATGYGGRTPITADLLNRYETVLPSLVEGCRHDTARLDTALTRVGTAEDDIDALETTAGTHGSRLDELESTAVDLLETTTTDGARITQAESDIDTLADRAALHDSEIDALDTRLGAAESDIAALAAGGGGGGGGSLSATTFVNDGAFTVTSKSWYHAPKIALYPGTTDPGDVEVVDSEASTSLNHGGVLRCVNGGLYMMALNFRSGATTNTALFAVNLQSCSSEDGTVLAALARFTAYATNTASMAGAVFIPDNTLFKISIRNNPGEESNDYTYVDGVAGATAGTEIGLQWSLIKVA